VLTVLGVCMVYLILCNQLINNFIGPMSDLVVEPITIMGSFLAVVSWMPSLRKISFMSLVGDAALVVAMVCVIIYGFKYYYPFKPLDSYVQFGTTTIMGFYGPVVFLYAIHMLVVPLHNEMANPALFERTLDISLITVVISNGTFAMLAYLLFDTHIPQRDAITAALVTDYLYLNKIMDVALVVDLTFTFSVIFVAGRDVVEKSLGWKMADTSLRTHLKRMAVRTTMVAICIIGAVFLHKSFGPLVDFISGLTMSPLCFVLPPALYLHNLWPAEYRRALVEGKSRSYQLFICGVNVFIILLGCVTTVYSTINSVQEIVAAVRMPSN